MARPLTTHTRRVFWLKITLPIAAVLVLSTLFLFARRVNFEDALPYAEVDIDALANDPRLTAPEYSGMTDDGATMRIAARLARPGAAASDPTTADDIVAVYQDQGGASITLQARKGTFGADAKDLNLSGGVSLATSDGYELTSADMAAALGTTTVHATGPVKGVAPFGTLSAGEMLLSGPSDARHLVFKGGVRLLYQPTN